MARLHNKKMLGWLGGGGGGGGEGRRDYSNKDIMECVSGSI